MANIKITNLQSAEAALILGSEDLTNSIRDLSEEELKINGGSKGHGKGEYEEKEYEYEKKEYEYEKKPYYSYEKKPYYYC
jgi:hypothetical protein